jgi:hypothetical protein
MRLIWTGEQPVSDTRSTLEARGYDPAQLGLSEDRACRITRSFPVLISRSGRFIEEAFSFLFDVAFVRGSTRSTRTLETYAESLASWLAYAEQKDLQWRRPTPVMLAAYRDYLLGTDGVDRRGTRPLSRRTVNLRLTVAIELYKHLGWITSAEPTREASFAFGPRGAARREAPRSHAGRQDFRRAHLFPKAEGAPGGALPGAVSGASQPVSAHVAVGAVHGAANLQPRSDHPEGIRGAE